jgi:hypothetical protein
MYDISKENLDLKPYIEELDLLLGYCFVVYVAIKKIL